MKHSEPCPGLVWRCLVISALLPLLLSAGCLKPEGVRKPGGHSEESPTYPGPGKMLLTVVSDGAIHVDGDLSDWSDLPRTYISACWHRTLGKLAPGDHPDRATVQIARDSTTLYAAYRVVDEEVINPFDEHGLYNGDSLSLFVDVRPEGARGEPGVLGASEYTPGCYEILYAPVNVDGKAQARRFHVVQPRDPKDVRASAQLLADGYALEMAIPFSELNNAPAERFNRPIGIDAAVNDVKSVPKGGVTPRVQYAWQRSSEHWIDASVLGRTVPTTLGAPRSQVVAYVPSHFVEDEDQRGFVSGVAVPIDSPLDESMLALDVAFAGGRADRPAEEKDWEVPAEGARPQATIHPRVWEDPVLGLRLVEKRLEFSQVVGGRYTVTSRFAGVGESLSRTVHAYYRERKQWNEMCLLEPKHPGEALTQAIASSMALGLPCHHVFDEAEAQVRVLVAGEPAIVWSLSEAAEAPERAYRVRLDFSPLHGENGPAWNVTATLLPRVTRVSVPVAKLAEGAYALRGTVIDPEGREKATGRGSGTNMPVPLSILVVHRGREYVLPSTVTEAPNMLTKAVAVGDPYRERYPNDDRLHCYARSIWDLQAYRGRIYTCCGDYNDNQGPVEVYSFAPDPAPDHGFRFVNEFTCDEEAIHVMRELASRLVVPGADARESWELGNIYIKEEGAWRKLRTVPNGIHVGDVAWFDGKLYATASTQSGGALFESSDWGETWTRHNSADQAVFGDDSFDALTVMRGKLLIGTWRGDEFLYVYEKGAVKPVLAPFFPGSKEGVCSPARLTAYKEGTLYTTTRSYFGQATESPLFFVEEPEEGALLVEAFRGKFVQDIVVRGDRCYVLTCTRSGDSCDGALYTSTDLKDWVQLARFTTPALAHSLEELDGDFFIGIACQMGEANPMSGRICRLE